MNEVLLRGCTLKNSGFVIGLVVYTGPESRIQMNAAEPPRKQGAEHSRRRLPPWSDVVAPSGIFGREHLFQLQLVAPNSSLVATPQHHSEVLHWKMRQRLRRPK